MTTEQRFWSKVRKVDECWVWTASASHDGYGAFGVGGRKGGMVRAHRFSYSLTHGPIPDGKMVLHRCDNRRCVNPNHLFLGDAKSNGEDMAKKDRSTHGERNPRVKLSEGEVCEMRGYYSRGRGTLKDLGLRYGVAKSTAHAVVSGVNWKRSYPHSKDPSNTVIDKTSDGLKF